MNNKIKSDKYRKRSVTALVTGIVAICLAGMYNFLWMPISNYLLESVDSSTLPYIMLPFIAIILGLSITAVTCGSIDLKKIKTKLFSAKGKGFDIAGIVMGGLFLLFAIFFMAGELIFPH